MSTIGLTSPLSPRLTNPIIFNILSPFMSRAESGHGQEDFSVGGERIGGPSSYWNRITEEGTIIGGAWEFINQSSQNGKLDGYTFSFPQEALADIYIQDKDGEKVFTAMGKTGITLDESFKVSKIQLYLHSREWDEKHQGQWSEWRQNGALFEQTNNWFPIGMTTQPKEEKIREEPKPKSTKQRQRPKHLLRWALAGSLALGGTGLWLSDQFSTAKDTHFNYQVFDLRPGGKWNPPNDTFVIIPIPPESGIKTTVQNRPSSDVEIKTNPGKYLIMYSHTSNQDQFPLTIEAPVSNKNEIFIKYKIVAHIAEPFGIPVIDLPAVAFLANQGEELMPKNSSGLVINVPDDLSGNYCAYTNNVDSSANVLSGC